MSAPTRWLREEWPIRYSRHGWRWGWLGNGWNCLQLGKFNVWFGSGPSPRERLRRRFLAGSAGSDT